MILATENGGLFISFLANLFSKFKLKLHCDVIYFVGRVHGHDVL